ncbi:Hypothetical_protein [Hexamita inflata]|uniref:Hypothetical_protein n=1 Tax=Hexamita inflata TaxID=28002 RepID=A0ABP1HEU9_9EUKA
MEAQSPFYLHPVQFQQSALPTIQSLRYAYSGSESSTAHVGEIFRMMEELSQDELHEFWSIMSQIHACEVKHIQEYCSSLQQSISQDSSDSLEAPRQRAKRLVTQNVLKTSGLVKSALIQVVRNFGVQVEDQVSDRDLCLLVNETVENDNNQQFWNKMAVVVPSKTKKQLYDFYHTSFEKALFDTQISKEDKVLIEKLNAEHPNEKPAALAHVFLEKTGRNVMKHNVVMCFVNIRRYALKSQK